MTMSASLLALSLALASAPPLAVADDRPRGITAGAVVNGFERPVHVTHAGDGSGRIFVVEQRGIVRVVRAAGEGRFAIDQEPFLDIRAYLGGAEGEQGLLGLAFHPRFKENGRLFIAYTGARRANTVAELVVDEARAKVVGPPKVLLAIDDFAGNHNGGHLVFAPSSTTLWIGTGDGGGAGDPRRTGQDDASLLGKMLLLDVDAPGAKPIVWGKGLRNPWRYAFDTTTRALWIADVGQNAWEEVHVIDDAPAKAPGLNFGWSTMEGRVCFRGACDEAGLELPVFVYGHDESGGCSITGGVVVEGRFVFGDYCSGRVWTLRVDGRSTKAHVALASGRRVSSFGLDERGGMWLVDHGGAIVALRLAP